jgi:phospholipase A1
MHAVIVVPGIMGTELFLPGSASAPDEKIWPPTALETQFGYKRRDKLASPRAVPGQIITNVLCFNFYKPLLDYLQDLGFKPDGAEKRLVPFPYDWRRDLFDTAGALAATVDAVHAMGAARISLIGHSMGGLICRLLLEAETWRDRPWFETVDQLIAIATPHLGAPLALGRILGIDSAFGISGEDLAWLASREEFPSAYQLLPPPGDAICWNQADAALASLDIYESGIAVSLGLKPTLLARARALHGVLSANAVAPHIRYFYFAATGHRTATRLNVFRDATGTVDPTQTMLTLTADGGDGTVPMVSALPRAGQRHIATNEHATAFKGDPFHKVFVRLLGGNEGPALEIAAKSLALSIESPVLTVGADIEVLLHAITDIDDPMGMFDEVRGELLLRKIRDGEAIAAEEVRRVPLAYVGPPVNRLRFYLAPLDKPGHYQISFIGTPGNAPPETFGVCAKLSSAVK